MGQYQIKLPDGTVGFAESQNDVPTPQEVQEAVRMFEAQRSSLTGPQKAGLEAGAGIPPERTQVMQSSDPREVLMRQAAENLRTQQAMQGAPAEHASGVVSGAGALGGGLVGARLGSKLGPYGAAGGALVGSAIGAGGGKIAGYHVPGFPETPLTAEEQFKAGLDASYTDLKMNALFGLAGAGVRTARNIQRSGVRMVTDKVFGFNTPDVINRVSEARTLGIRLTPMDISPRVAKVYSSIFGNVPAISGPLRTAEAARAVEVSNVLQPIIGPLESGVNEVVLGRNMVRAAGNANTVRKDWYDRIYKQATQYFEAHPEVAIRNDAVDPARRYMYEESRGGLPYTRATQRSVETETNRATQGASGSLTQQSTQGMRSTNAQPPVAFENASQVSREAQSATQSTQRASLDQTKLEKLQAGTFENPTDVDEFIRSVAGSPEQLNYWQLKKLTENIGAAMKKATPTQQRTLAQMADNMDTATEQVADPAARQLITRSRNLYRQTMEFFENPQAQEFVRADPSMGQNVRELRTRKNIAKSMSSELFENLFNDVPVEGVRNISKLIGPNNMKDAVERDVARRFDKYVKSSSEGNEAVDWNGLRNEFGLNNPTNAKRASTVELLKDGQYPIKADGLGKMIDVLEREVGPTIPPLAKMYVRGAAIGGPQTALKAFLATKALRMFGGPVGSVAAVLGFRKFSKFLASPERLTALSTVLDSTIKAPGVKNMAARQVLRYLATDLATDKRGGEEPSPDEINAEYGRIAATLEDSGYVQPNQPAGEPQPIMQLRDLYNQATGGSEQ